MNLDLCVLILVALFAVTGYFSGAVRQIAHWVGLAAAYFCAKPMGAYWGPTLALRMNWPASLTTIGLTGALLPVIFLVVYLASRIFLNMIEPGQERGTLDRGLGATVGAAKGGAIMFALISLAVVFEQPLLKIGVFDVEAKTKGSSFAAYVRGHNLFGDPRLQALEKLANKSADPAFLNDLKDSEVREALKGKDKSALLKNPAIAKLLDDPAFLKKLEQF